LNGLLIEIARLLWAYVLRPVLWLLWHVIVPVPSWRTWLGARFLARFGDTSNAEAWGYAIWGLMGAVVAIPEIWAAASGAGFTWPTISSTTGHLEDLTPVVAVAPVALIVMAAYAVVRPPTNAAPVPTPPGQPPSFSGTVRNSYGRLERGEIDVTTGEVDTAGRQPWPVASYFFLVSCFIALTSYGASWSDDPWYTGYVLYGLIGLLWIVLPSVASYWFERDVPFLTLFYTVRSLERRVHFVAYVVAAGLGILLVHLALYPWPDLARGGAKYAGFTPGHAEQRAERLVGPGLSVSTKYRGISRGEEAWFVYFETRKGHRPTGCHVILTRHAQRTVGPCT
jgi:hypothetical protein